MLEYFSYKKVKKSQADKEKGKEVQVKEQPEPLLSPEDENYLGRIISAEGTPPPLPDRPSWILNPEVGDTAGNDKQMVLHDEATQAEHDTRVRDDAKVQERKKSSSHQRKKSSSNEGKKSLDKGKGKEKEKESDKKTGGVFSFFQKKVSAYSSADFMPKLTLL